ncbi:MAG: hypothetical protein M3425_02790 [Actinomycetota bacterium]|nr:hypothetical protein [Actinomycetota bacterium]MDQ3528869.1 hypothetical protein [Actinomycetota bacterium]
MRVEAPLNLVGPWKRFRGYLMPAAYEVRLTATAEDSHELMPYHLVLDVETSDDGPVCTGMQVNRREGGAPITSNGLRRVPVAKLLRITATAVAAKSAAAGPGRITVSPLHTDGVGDFYARYRQGPRRDGGPLTDDELTRVAEVYRAALQVGDPPTAAVAQVLHASRSTAGRWVMQARRRRLLAPAPGPRQAGERNRA